MFDECRGYLCLAGRQIVKLLEHVSRGRKIWSRLGENDHRCAACKEVMCHPAHGKDVDDDRGAQQLKWRQWKGRCHAGPELGTEAGQRIFKMPIGSWRSQPQPVPAIQSHRGNQLLEEGVCGQQLATMRNNRRRDTQSL